MKKTSLVLAAALGLFVLFTISVMAEDCVAKYVSSGDRIALKGLYDYNQQIIKCSADSCTDWMLQSNGCYWRTCVDSEGHQYCEECCGQNCSRVECK